MDALELDMQQPGLDERRNIRRLGVDEPLEGVEAGH